MFSAALDLEKNKSDLHWIQAVVLSQSGASNSQINQTFLKAMSLRPKLGDIGDAHYSAISKLFLQFAEQMTKEQQAAGSKASNLYQLRATMLLWQDQHEEALAVCKTGSTEFPGDPDLLILEQLIQLENGGEAEDLKPINTNDDHMFAWHAHMANAKLFRSRSDGEKESEQLLKAVDAAKADWQQSRGSLEPGATPGAAWPTGRRDFVNPGSDFD